MVTTRTSAGSSSSQRDIDGFIDIEREIEREDERERERVFRELDHTIYPGIPSTQPLREKYLSFTPSPTLLL